MEQLDFRLDRDELCDRLGGGLPRGSLVAVEGPTGAGKSILVQRLVYGLLANRHSVSLVSTELTTAGFLGQMESLKYDVWEPITQEQLVFIPVHPVLAARAPREDGLLRIAKARRIYEKQVVVFDTFSKFLGDHERHHGSAYASVDQVEAVLHLFKRLTSVGCTVILTFERGQAQESIVSLFRDAADMDLSLQFELQGNAAARRIVVNRMSRAAGRFGEVLGFRVEAGVGIVIEIKSVV